MGQLLSHDRRRRVVNGIFGLMLVWTRFVINQYSPEALRRNGQSQYALAHA